MDDDIFSSFAQLDGNISINSSYYIFQQKPQNITTQIGHRPNKITLERPHPCRKIVKRDNKSIQALSLPKVSLYNVRALLPKLGSFARDMEERESDLSFITEVWEVLENKKHQFKLEELFEIRGIKYISTPRPGRRGVELL